MALLSFPKLLILDEPTNGLDPAGIGEIRELIQSLPTRYGITVLLSSHLLSEIDQMATTVGIISEWNLLFQGSRNRLREKSNSTIYLKTEDNMQAEQLLINHGYNPTFIENRLYIGYLEDKEVANVNR